MSSKTPLPRLITDKIPLRYVDETEKLAPFFKSFEQYLDNVKTSRERLDSPTEGFVLGSMDMISGDLKFEQGMHQECINDFTKASETFLKSQKITENQINEGTLQVPQEIMRELGRRAIYCQARITHAEALIELKKAKNVTLEERNVIKQFLELAAQAYQEELDVDEQNSDFFHKIQAKRNLFKVYIRLEEQKALVAKSISEQQYHYYQAIIQAQKAIFLGEKKIPKVYFEGVYKKIRDLSIKKFLNRADYFWEQGLIASANQNFSRASKLYWSGQRIYDSITKLEKRTEFDLQSMMFKVTALESDAKHELASDRNVMATELFKQASLLMQQLIKLVKQLGNTELVDLFTIQSAYFDGMNLFSSGLIAYDKEDYKGALKSIKIGQRSLKAVLSSAREMDNAPLIQSCKDGLKQIETYIETLTLLAEPVPETQTEVEQETQTEVEQEPQAEVEQEPQTEVEQEPQAEVEPETKAEAESEKEQEKNDS